MCYILYMNKSNHSANQSINPSEQPREYSLEEYPQVAENIINILSEKKTRTIALHGNLGAGKTTLSQEIIKQLGVTEVVTSPTFVIEKEYQTGVTGGVQKKPSHINRIVHIDTYRLKNADELLALDFQKDLADPQTIILIEWPELVEGLLPQDTIHIYIDYLDKDRRSITIK